MVAWVWVNGVDRCGGMARWRSMWWVSRLARSAVVGFNIVLVSKIDSFFVFFFFFLLVIMWWLFLVDVVVVGGF